MASKNEAVQWIAMVMPLRKLLLIKIDKSKTVKGYEINITKYFSKYKPLRPLADMRADILAMEKETEGMIQEVLEG